MGAYEKEPVSDRRQCGAPNALVALICGSETILVDSPHLDNSAVAVTEEP